MSDEKPLRRRVLEDCIPFILAGRDARVNWHDSDAANALKAITEDKKETGICLIVREKAIELNARVNAVQATIITLHEARDSLIEDAQEKILEAEEQGAIYMKWKHEYLARTAIYEATLYNAECAKSKVIHMDVSCLEAEDNLKGAKLDLTEFQGEADKLNFFGGGVANIPEECCFLAKMDSEELRSTFEAKVLRDGLTLEQAIVQAGREGREELRRFLVNGGWEKNPFMKDMPPIAIFRRKKSSGVESRDDEIIRTCSYFAPSTSEKENAPAFKSPPRSSSKKKRNFDEILESTRSPAATTGSRRFKTVRLTTPLQPGSMASSQALDRDEVGSSRNSFGPNSLEGGGILSPVEAVVIVSGKDMMHPIEE